MNLYILYILGICVNLCFSKRYIVESKYKIDNTEYIHGPNGYISMIDTNYSYISSLRDIIYREDSFIDIQSKYQQNISVPWGLDHLDGIYDKNYDYIYTGKGVNVYVIDTGVSHHDDFIKDNISRLTGISFVGTNKSDYDDCIGHGTHVASIIGGKISGVSKEANIIAIKIFDCKIKTYIWTLLSAMNWVYKQKKGIVNLSLSTIYISTVNDMVDKLVKKGHVVVTASGNAAEDACNYSPSSAKKAITTGCIDINDIYCGFTNEGSCVDVFAPGLDIVGANFKGGYKTYSGTSMSSSYVSGIAAQIRQKFPNMSPYIVRKVILNKSSINITTKFANSPKLSARIL